MASGCAFRRHRYRTAKQLASLLRQLFRQDWLFIRKIGIRGPAQLLRYLGRYTHRVAISDHDCSSSAANAPPFAGRLLPRQQAAKDGPDRHRVPSEFVQHILPEASSESGSMAFWQIAADRHA
jgi:hypothetical protein